MGAQGMIPQFQPNPDHARTEFEIANALFASAAAQGEKETFGWELHEFKEDKNVEYFSF